MTVTFLLDAHGAPIHICGYAAVFDLPSWPMGRNDGCCEIIKSLAFDHVLRHPGTALNCQFHHGGLPFIAGSLASDTLSVWADDFGLAFQAGPFMACGRNLALLNNIAGGEIRGASWSGWFGSARFEIIDGERVKVVRSFKSLDHISPVNEPAYPDTGVWLSSEDRYDLPPRLRALSDHWTAHRPPHDTGRALRKMARAVSRLPRRAASSSTPSRPQSRAVAARRFPVPVAVYNPAPAGLSQEAWEEFGFMEAAGRRAHKQAQARKQARQRKQRAA